MAQISKELESELERRVIEGGYKTLDELIRCALDALDGAPLADPRLEKALLAGLEGEDVEMSPDEHASIRQEALGTSDAKRKR